MAFEDRIRAIATVPAPFEREAACEKLEQQIAGKRTHALTRDEVSSLGEILTQKRPSALPRASVWRLLVGSMPHPRVKDLALEALRTPTDPDRGRALLYLRAQYPELAPGLMDQYRNDPDPAVRYELSEYVTEKNPEAGVNMKIALLPVESHELNDALIMEISELGNERNLAELRRRDELAGDETRIFRTIADLLERRLTGGPLA